MRLTLRTLLAYMDDILEPDDAQAIGKKIEESEFATGLLQRARDVMQRLRLAAPEVTDGEKGLDPNTVAEYLDNTLGSDRVTDFEKVCLESDVHLAEVAASHQILTLVLGEPAEVDPAGRQRMYQLPDQLENSQSQSASPAASSVTASSVTGSSVTGPSPPTDAESQSRRNKPTVPAYLRETRPNRPRRRLPVLAVGLVTALLAVGLLAALNQFEPGTPLARFLGIGAGDGGPVARAPSEGAPAEKVEPPVAPTESTQVVADPSESEPTAAEAKPLEATPPVQPPATTPSAESPAVDSATTDPSGMAAPPAEEGTTVADKPATQPVQPVTPGPSKLPEGDVAKIQPDKLTPVPPATVPPATAPPAKAPTEVAMRPETAKPVVEEPGSAAKPDEPASVPPTPVGKLVSDDQALLQFDSESAAWLRVPTGAGVLPQNELLALPTYRPIIALAAEVELTLVGGTQVALQAADQEGVAGLTVRYGRCVLHANGKANSRLRLRVGDRSGVLTFRDTKSTVAIEVNRLLVPGKNPETDPAEETVDLYAISGRLLWAAEGSDRPMEFDALARLRLDGHSPEPAAALRELPKWTVSDAVGLLDRRASSTLNQELQANRPVSLTLRELIDHRQREVRWLAMRCLGHVGEFDPLTSALNDPAQKLLWPDYIEHLQSALSRGPEVSVQIRRDLQKDYRADTAEMFRLLCGFTKEDLVTDRGGLLVKGLDHKVLAVRVLSFWNLKGLTGLGLYYQPEATAAKRRQAVAKWTQRIESGQIGGKSPAGDAAGKKPTDTDPNLPDAPLPEGMQ